jgi:hypothetical protein
MNNHSVGQRVMGRHGGGVLIVALVDLYSEVALATTDGRKLSDGGWCLHRNHQVGHFEYFGGSNEGAHGLLDLDRECHRAIDQWGPDGRFARRPADLGFEW